MTTASGGTANNGGVSASGGDVGLGGSLGTGGAPSTGGSSPEEAGVITCPSGSYSGKLTGLYTGSGGLAKTEIGSSFTMQVASDGSVTGSYSGPSLAKATLLGAVDCRTGELTIAIQNGTYQFGLVPVRFEGTLRGTHDRAQDRFIEGTWVFTEPDNAMNGGSGSWVQSG